MDITEILQNERTLLLVRPEDLNEFAIKVADKILAEKSNLLKKIEPEKPLSQEEAVKFLGKSRQTLVAWRKKGVISAYRLGGRVYYKPSELLSALEKLNK